MAAQAGYRAWLMFALATATGVVVGAGGLLLVGESRLDSRIRTYILDNPDVIPEAMKRLEAKRAADSVTAHRADIERPFASAWAGARDADVTVTMFTDYSCGYCRASVADVERLIATDGRVRLVWRELPILGPGSEVAAMAALAAAQQGRYRQFHRQMFAAGPPDSARVAAVARQSGVRLDNDPAYRAELERNLALARALGLSGTPTFVVGGEVLQGAVGYDRLRAAVAAARAG